MSKDDPKEEPTAPITTDEPDEESPDDKSVPAVEESSPAKEEPEKPGEASEDILAEPVVSDKAEEPKPPSRREQLRVQDLLRKYGPPPSSSDAQAQSPSFRDKVDADEEVYQTLEETAKQYGTNQYQQGIDQARYYNWETLLKVDDPQVRSKYPEFDPGDKEKFHSALAESMYTKYLRFVGFDPGNGSTVPPSVKNPNIRYLDFVEAEMEFADELASQRVSTTTQNIARQAASTGLRPDGSSATRMDLTKAPEDMTDEELNAAISQSLPRDTRGRFTSR